MRAYPDQPIMEAPNDATADDAEDESGEPSVNHDFEREAPAWSAVDVRQAQVDLDDVPRRFVDGSNVHEAVAWLRDPIGYPVPVVLAELGGVCVRADGRELKREFAIVERAVSMTVDPFPWNEVEEFAAALSEHGLRLIAARPPDDEDGRPTMTFDFERMREQTRVSVLHEMACLEEAAWGHDREVPTIVDGRVGRFHRCGLSRYDVIGVIKQQRADYLHAEGWRVLYELQPGQRTPAFVLPSKHLEVVSWYLKLDGADGELPNWGIVRVEIPRARFATRGDDFAYVDSLSRCILEMRCRRSSYARGPVSLDPIVRAEQSLKSLFSSIPALATHFYRMTGL
jgi:hypothetical protein